MIKRVRNKMGQFISISSIAKNPNLLCKKIFRKVLSSFMRIFLLLLICPWITYAIKSKMIKRLAYALINFCNSNFMGIDEINEANDICADRKNSNDL